MVKKVLFLLMLAGAVLADSDTLLTCEEYGFRVFDFMNFPDTVNGDEVTDSSDMQKYIRMAFGTISLGIGEEKNKKIVVGSDVRWYNVDAGLLYVRDVAQIRKGITTPLIEIISLSQVYGASEYKEEMNAGDTIDMFYVHGDSIQFFPVPDFADTALVIYYAGIQHPDAANDTVWTPFEYKNAMIYLTAYLVETSRRGPMAAIYKQMYLDESALIIIRKSEAWRGKITK